MKIHLFQIAQTIVIMRTGVDSVKIYLRESKDELYPAAQDSYKDWSDNDDNIFDMYRPADEIKKINVYHNLISYLNGRGVTRVDQNGLWMYDDKLMKEMVNNFIEKNSDINRECKITIQDRELNDTTLHFITDAVVYIKEANI